MTLLSLLGGFKKAVTLKSTGKKLKESIREVENGQLLLNKCRYADSF